MNNSQNPGDRPDDGSREHGSRDSASSTPGGDNAVPQIPFNDGPWREHRAIGGPEPSGAPGGGGMVAAEFGAMLVWAAASFVIIFWLSGTFDWSWIVVVGVWLLTGLVVVWPGSDGLIARFLLGLRRPTMVENQRLAPIWYALANRSGVDPSTFTLWIERAETPTGSATGGNTVSVTSWALYTLPPSAEERPSHPEGLGSAKARGVPRTAPAANAPTAPRRNVCREISRATVGLPGLPHVPNCRPRESWCRMTCRRLTETCPNRYPAPLPLSTR